MGTPGPLTNQHLGSQYVLEELLGQGGFGAVYKARHILLNRPQAVKILLEQHFTSAKFRERFEREARTLAGLDHPNIVHVDDFGVENNRAYLVMTFVGGGTLQEVLRARGALPPDQVVRYLEQIAAALDYAHARNVVHLDLKPLNLLVHEDGRLLLSDFGLAHLMEQGAVEGSTSLQFGTPTYMAPEHLQGQPEQRSDVYALGIMVYQMLAGRVPFEGSNPAAILYKHLLEAPPPLGSIRPGLPAALDAVLQKALAKQPADRYATAGALLIAIRAALAGQLPAPARPAQPLGATIPPANPPGRGSSATTIAPPGGAATILPPGNSAHLGNILPVEPIEPVSPSGTFSSGAYAPVESFSGPPRVSGALPVGGNPVFQPVPIIPIPLQQMGIWTQGFTLLFALAAIAGSVLTLVGVIGVSIGKAYDTTIGDVMSLLAYVALGIICAVGLRFATSTLMRVGFALQLATAIAATIQAGVFVSFDTNPTANFPTDTISFLGLVLNVCNLISLVCVSYALVRWQPGDVGMTVLQLIGSIILTVIYTGRVGSSLGSVVSIIITLCVAFPAALLLLRFGCWRRYPVVILCLAVASLLFVLGTLVFPFGTAPLALTYILILIPNFLFNLGFLALVQTERVRKQGQII